MKLRRHNPLWLQSPEMYHYRRSIDAAIRTGKPKQFAKALIRASRAYYGIPERFNVYE